MRKIPCDESDFREAENECRLEHYNQDCEDSNFISLPNETVPKITRS